MTLPYYGKVQISHSYIYIYLYIYTLYIDIHINAPPLTCFEDYWVSYYLNIEEVIVEDFNNINLRKVLPRYYQHISCPTRSSDTLDRVYTPFWDGYKAPCPPFGKSDCISVVLKHKHDPLMTTTISLITRR